MNASQLSFAALGVAGISLAVTIGTLALRPAPAAAAPASVQRGEDPRVPELRTSLEELRREIGSLESRIALSQRAPGAESVDVRVELEAATAPLMARIDELEKSLRQVEESARKAELSGLSAIPMLEGLLSNGPDRSRLSVEEATRAALDPLSSEDQLLDALRTLRGERLEDGSDARSAEVVSAMMDLALRSDDPEVRGDVFRQMHGVSDPALLPTLLDVLANDGDAGVRAEAAETLDHYLDQPGVRAALEYAAANDPSGKVRGDAMEALGGGERKG